MKADSGPEGQEEAGNEEPGNTVFSPRDLVGGTVLSQDGQNIGRLKDIRGNGFLVDAPLQPDYWLPTDCILSVADQTIHISIPSDLIGDYTMDPPEAYISLDARWTDEVAAQFRDEWERRYGDSGRRWLDYEMAFRYGYERGLDPQYADRSWEDVEEDLQKDYPGYTSRIDPAAVDMPWDRLRDAIRDAFNSTRDQRAA
ncbi:MAG TPA: hypothetical protein VGK54_13230 [Chloroflexota bacterium]|jgi:hypothetical protein